jgi:NADH-quinone oxidoreductase subunit E
MTEAGERGGRASEPILRDGEQPMSTGSNQEGEAPAQFSGETRGASWEALEVQAKEIIARYPQPRSALLPLLHLLQAEEGYVSPYGIEFAAEQLDLTTAEVAGVATFYTMYKRRPVGDYHVGVCTNTLCAVMGGDTIFAALKEHLGVGNDETTEDGAVTLEHIECNAACDFAPVVMVNWEFFDNQTPESAKDLVDRLRSGNPPTPSRGADHLCTWKEASRVLAGFSDGRATEGANAGPATLVGLTIAKERGWSVSEPGAERAIVDNDSEGRDGGQ